MIDVSVATDILKHFYSGEHREYPHCPQCVEWNVRDLKARLSAKHKKAA